MFASASWRHAPQSLWSTQRGAATSLSDIANGGDDADAADDEAGADGEAVGTGVPAAEAREIVADAAESKAVAVVVMLSVFGGGDVGGGGTVPGAALLLRAPSREAEPPAREEEDEGEERAGAATGMPDVVDVAPLAAATAEEAAPKMFILAPAPAPPLTREKLATVMTA